MYNIELNMKNILVAMQSLERELEIWHDIRELKEFGLSEEEINGYLEFFDDTWDLSKITYTN